MNEYTCAFHCRYGCYRPTFSFLFLSSTKWKKTFLLFTGCVRLVSCLAGTKQPLWRWPSAIRGQRGHRVWRLDRRTNASRSNAFRLNYLIHDSHILSFPSCFSAVDFSTLYSNNLRVSNIRVSNRTLIYNVCPKSALA